jgi:hypothetical protein
MCSKHFYVGRKIDGHSIDLLDSPGVGDQDVTPMAVLTLIERVIGKNNHGRSGVFSGKASILLCGLE